MYLKESERRGLENIWGSYNKIFKVERAVTSPSMIDEYISEFGDLVCGWLITPLFEIFPSQMSRVSDIMRAVMNKQTRQIHSDRSTRF